MAQIQLNNADTDGTDDRLPTEKTKNVLRYPSSIPFILVSKLFERLSTESLRVVMLLYLIDQLAFSAAMATVLFHIYNTIGYLMAIVGALLADGWCGRYWATFYTHLVFVLGTLMFALCAVRELHIARTVALTAAAIISMGNGCMKPCLVALSGDQFQLPEQRAEMATFFSAFYFCLKCSSALMSAVAPALRSDIPGLSADRAYLVVFGTTAGGAIISILVFLSATTLYVCRPAAGKQLAQLGHCIWYAVRKRVVMCFKCRRNDADYEHWLDVAEPRYGEWLVQDIKVLLRVWQTLSPLPMYWALNEQISSTWTLQASRMSGDVWGWYTFKPDQMQVVMHVLVIIFIPLFDAVVYPALRRIGLRSALVKIVLAGWLSAAAFAIAGALELWIRNRGSDATKVHMLWMMPQYMLLAGAEAIVGVCGYLYIDQEAPANFKTILQAALLMTHSFGNIIDVVVLGVVRVDNQAIVFFLFAAMMVLDTIWMQYLTQCYHKRITEVTKL